MHDTIQNFVRENSAWIEHRRSTAQCLLVLLAVALYSRKSLTVPMIASIILFLVRLQKSSEFRILIFLCKNAVSSGDVKNVRMCLPNADNSRYVYWISYFYPFIAIRKRVHAPTYKNYVNVNCMTSKEKKLKNMKRITFFYAKSIKLDRICKSTYIILLLYFIFCWWYAWCVHCTWPIFSKMFYQRSRSVLFRIEYRVVKIAK